MIGKSYDGTLSNGVAATGVEGLKTIVPISAISAWYTYSRTGGVRHNTNYPGSSSTRRSPTGPRRGHARPPEPPPRSASRSTPTSTTTPTSTPVTATPTATSTRSGATATTTRTPAKIKASVFITHGFQDDNVRMDQRACGGTRRKAGVERKLWLLRAGHADPFESRRAEWVDTLHRWFDHWLYGVKNGILSEPRSRSKRSRDVWKDYASWPIDGTQNVDLFLRATENPLAAGTLGGPTAAARPTRSSSRSPRTARPR